MAQKALGILQPLRRVHVCSIDWAMRPGTDFWLLPCAGDYLTASVRANLADNGWTTTSLAEASGSTADFMSADDKGTPGYFTTNAASDLLQSPAIFGDYIHAWQAQRIMEAGSLPTKLCWEAWAAFATASNNETGTCIGLCEDGGSIIVAADAMATICSDGTNWVLRSGAATLTSNTAVSTTLHLFKVVINRVRAVAEAYLDGVKLVSSAGATTLAVQNDEWPAAFGGGVVAAGSNRINIGAAHIWYEWG